MITVTRLNGGVFALNPDLIERVEAMPDTTITLVDGKLFVVRESVEDVVHRVREAKAAVISLAHALDRAAEHAPPPVLRVVPDLDGQE